MLAIRGRVERHTELIARAAGAAFAHRGQGCGHRRIHQLHLRLVAHGLGKPRLQRGHIHDPGQSLHPLRSGIEMHRAVLVAVDTHGADRSGMRRIGPTAQRFQQAAGGRIQRIGPHVRCGRGLGAAGRYQGHFQPITCQQQRQRIADNAAAANADIKGLGHGGIVGGPLCPAGAVQNRLFCLSVAFSRSIRVSFDPASDLSGTIERLFVYPVKSCAGIEVQEALLTEAGLDLDRAWMVVDSEGVFLTQRNTRSLRRAPPFAALDVAINRGTT